jgi:hypothetical protein
VGLTRSSRAGKHAQRRRSRCAATRTGRLAGLGVGAGAGGVGGAAGVRRRGGLGGGRSRRSSQGLQVQPRRQREGRLARAVARRGGRGQAGHEGGHAGGARRRRTAGGEVAKTMLVVSRTNATSPQNLHRKMAPADDVECCSCVTWARRRGRVPPVLTLTTPLSRQNDADNPWRMAAWQASSVKSSTHHLGWQRRPSAPLPATRTPGTRARGRTRTTRPPAARRRSACLCSRAAWTRTGACTPAWSAAWTRRRSCTAAAAARCASSPTAAVRACMLRCALS